MTSILDLPSELIASIFTYLDDASVLAGRQAAKTIERASFSIFGKRFFRKKGFMITSPSLQVLQHIASHEQLRSYVQHVWFNPDCFTFSDSMRLLPTREDDGFDDEGDILSPEDFGNSDDTSGIWDQSQHDAFKACVDDHKALLHDPIRLQHELATAFATLPNVFVIGMRRSEDHKPWGWSKLMDVFGTDPRILGRIPNGPMSTLSGPTLLFIAIIGSVAASNTRLRRLYTDAIEIDNISTEALTQESLNKACNSIWYLELNATKAWIQSTPLNEPWNYITELEPKQYGNGLVKLLSATPNLREIGLMIFPDRKQSHLVAPAYQQPQSWRTAYAFITMERIASNPGVDLRHLRRVKLEKLTTTPATLIDLLSSGAPKMTSLKLRDIRLLSEPDDEDPRPWQPFFAFLHRSCQSLAYILLHHLAHDTGGVRFVAELPPLLNLPRLPTVANAGDFTDYEDITVEAQGRDAVRARLQALLEGHWYGGNTFTYAMDQTAWHTDTSDEDW